jgi:hypothetical protein
MGQPEDEAPDPKQSTTRGIEMELPNAPIAREGFFAVHFFTVKRVADICRRSVAARSVRYGLVARLA